MKIRFTIDGKELATATLMDNATARDFLTLLPLTVTLEDYAATEKITYLPRKLSTAGAPAGTDPSVGDIAYYAPWGNLAILLQGRRACQRAGSAGQGRFLDRSVPRSRGAEGDDRTGSIVKGKRYASCRGELWPGKSEHLKRRLADKIVCTEKVYKPDIQGKWDMLYQKPGYDPF